MTVSVIFFADNNQAHIYMKINTNVTTSYVSMVVNVECNAGAGFGLVYKIF